LSTPTNIIVLNDYCYSNGGASRVAIDEAIALAASGNSVTFIGAKGPISDQLKDAPLTAIELGQTELAENATSPLLVLKGLWNWEARNKLFQILDGFDRGTTVVHVHGYTKSLTAASISMVCKMGFATVLTLHDFFSACPNGAFFDYQMNQPCTRTALSFSCILANCDKKNRMHKMFRVLRSTVQKHAAEFPSSVKTYISLSRQSEALLKPYLPADASIYPLANMTTIKRYPPVEITATKSVIAVGRLDREKGVEVLVEASELSGIPIVFVGDGPLRSLVEASPNCRVTGWVGPQEVEQELNDARTLVFPSLWYETYGLVVAEAAARGVPAIVSDVSAASERIRHNVSGWIFPSGDVAALAECLRATLDIANVQRAGAEVYDEFWLNPPDQSRHVEALLNIYDRALGDAGV
jgi:glycosyltransferase involved in cell wall biosynthesis